VVAQYLAAMSEKDRVYQAREFSVEEARAIPAPQEIVEDIPNIDHRFGDAKAEIIGINVLDAQGVRASLLQPNSTIVVRISVRAKENLDSPSLDSCSATIWGRFRRYTNRPRASGPSAMLAGDVAPSISTWICLRCMRHRFFFAGDSNGSLEHFPCVIGSITP
jgi:hypothetical protein